MLQQQVFVLNTILIILDALVVIAAGFSAFQIKFHLYDGMWHLNDYAFNMSVFLVMMINNYIMNRLGLYSDRRPSSYLGLSVQVMKAVTIDFMILAVVIFILGLKTYSRFFFLAFMSLTFLYLIVLRGGFRFYLNQTHKRGFNLRNILIVGDRERSEILGFLLNQQLSMGHQVMGRLSVSKEELADEGVLGSIEKLPAILRKQPVDEVIFALDRRDQRVNLAPYLLLTREMGIPVRILPAMWQPGGQMLSVESCQKIPFLTMQVDNFNAAGLVYKRLLDIVGGMAGCLILALFYPFVALTIKLDSPGPVIFKQERMGRHGRVFRLFKFRSMYKDAEQRKAALICRNEMDGGMFKMENDPRITPVGRWLRSSSLDEFPQFLNVLKGEMSLVGTRPPTIEEVEKYHPRHLKRIAAKPGITGLWQVSGRSRIQSFDDVVALDCKYLESWRFADDIKILLKTVWVVLTGKGAL